MNHGGKVTCATSLFCSGEDEQLIKKQIAIKVMQSKCIGDLVQNNSVSYSAASWTQETTATEKHLTFTVIAMCLCSVLWPPAASQADYLWTVSSTAVWQWSKHLIVLLFIVEERWDVYSIAKAAVGSYTVIWLHVIALLLLFISPPCSEVPKYLVGQNSFSMVQMRYPTHTDCASWEAISGDDSTHAWAFLRW